MYEVKYSEEFECWLDSLPDSIVKKKIRMRLYRVTMGNFGYMKRLNEFLWEMKDKSPSEFRIYYTFVGNTVCFIISGGFKATQSKDIEYATQIAKQLIEEQRNECH